MGSSGWRRAEVEPLGGIAPALGSSVLQGRDHPLQDRIVPPTTVEAGTLEYVASCAGDGQVGDGVVAAMVLRNDVFDGRRREGLAGEREGVTSSAVNAFAREHPLTRRPDPSLLEGAIGGRRPEEEPVGLGRCHGESVVVTA